MNDNWFELGGNSLQAGQVAALVRSQLGVQAEIQSIWLFEHQTVRLLAAKIQRDVLDKAEDPNAPPPLTPLDNAVSAAMAQLTMRDRFASPRGFAPLSFQQARVAVA